MIDPRGATITITAALYSELTPVLATLSEQPEASHLCETLALAEGFQFQMVVCETPRVGAALLLWLDTEVAKRRGEPVSLMRLSPYPLVTGDTHTGLSQEQLAQIILEPLVSTPDTAAEPRMIFIDASPASSQDHDAWTWLFQRLNERRNLFASQLRGPLSICLPPSLEVEFVRAAPDLWSIRSTALTIKGPTVQRAPTLLARQTEPFSSAPDVTARELEEARQAAESGNPSALWRLAILLSRQAESDQRKGQLSEALRTLVEEVLPLCEQLGDADLRAATLRAVARIHQLRGGLNEALSLLNEEVLPVYEKLGDVRSRAITLGQIADILEARGQLDEALRIHREEALPVFEKLGDVRSRALTQGKIADILEARGLLDEALRIRREEELPVFEKLGDVRSRAITQGKIADILFARGQLDEALRIRREEELPVFEKLGDVRSRAITQGQIADILFARGQLDEALRIHREEELPVYEKLGDVRSRAITQGKIADILEARGQLDEALRIRREEELPVYEKLGDVRSLLVGRANLAQLYLSRSQEGDRQQAIDLLHLALEKAEEMRIPEAEQIRSILKQKGLPSP